MSNKKKCFESIAILVVFCIAQMFLTVRGHDQTELQKNNFTLINEHFKVDFFDSVARVLEKDGRLQYLNQIKSHPYWLRAKKLYDMYAKNNHFEKQTKLRIPKIIHQIWLGGPLPEKYKLLQQSWIRNHPDWKYKLWTEKEIAAFKLKNQTAYDESTNYAQKSDIARYEILFREGGVYVDTDFECFQPFDLFHYCFDFYVGIDKFMTDFTVQNCIIGSIPGHPIMGTAIKTLDIHKQLNPNYYENIQCTTGPFHLTECYKRHIANHVDRTLAFPPSFFFPPLCNKSNTQGSAQHCVWPETMGIHYQDASWVN